MTETHNRQTLQNDLFSLAGKTALVTGGARGLGFMIAQSLVDAGARVWITSRSEEDCQAAVRTIGAGCFALAGNVGTPEGVVELGKAYRGLGGGPLDILINNAGRTWGAPLADFPDKAWPGVMAVNVQAPFRMTQEFLPELSDAATAADPARVIFIGSAAGMIINDLNAYSYVASKAAIHQLAKQMASDLVDRHITVNTVAPGYFPTSMTAHLRDDPDSGLDRKIPMHRLGGPSDIGGAVIFLASRAGAYVTGVTLPVDGGLTGCT